MLDQITSPQDIKKMTNSQLVQLAAEIRQRLITVTSQTGGHLAPNLGAVELTLALHRVFNTPEDEIVWDVGHQSYVHKLLTNRNKDFDKLRTYEGLSGFPKRHESPHDVFGTGHASTSVSAAAGFALARDLAGRKNQVIAVIGDGAMTGGMVFEAMNHVGHLGLDMKIILNDNEMSIDPNVGGLSDYLTRMRTNVNYQHAKEDMEGMLKRIPTVGSRMVDMADRLKDLMKYMLVPGGFFEEIGFKYYGPINGHDMQAMTQVFENTKHIKRPVLIHCITKKGKGYWPAEKNPERFHGTGAFNVRTGERTSASSKPSYTDVFAKTLITLGKEDERICAITAAMGSGTGVAAFQKAFPERAFDVGIAEEHATTLAAAMALAGRKPVLALYSTFMQRGFDQLIHDCAIQEAPVVVALDRAGLVGEDGPTHHGVFDLSYLRMIPQMTIMAPKDERELQNMLYSALKYDRLVAIRYPRGSGSGAACSDVFEYIERGQGEWLNQGTDLTILAVGAMVDVAQEARARLQAEGFDIGVVNARFVKPLDEGLLREVFSATSAVVTLEDNVLAGGFGSAVLEWAAESAVNKPITRIGIPDRFVDQGAVSALHRDLGLDADGVVAKIRRLLQKEPENV